MRTETMDKFEKNLEELNKKLDYVKQNEGLELVVIKKDRKLYLEWKQLEN